MDYEKANYSPDNSQKSGAQHKVNLTVSWRLVALTATFVAIGATGALILVATSRDANALATIALALAIIAFIIQIMVFIAQVFASNQQATRNEEVYAQMHGLLEGLKGTTQGTQQTLNSYVGRLIQAATMTASETVQESSDNVSFDPEDFQRRLIEEVKTVTRPSDPSTDQDRYIYDLLRAYTLEPSEAGVSWRLFEPLKPEDQAIIRQLETYPDEEDGAHFYAQLRNLSPLAQQQLREFARDELSQRKSGAEVGLHKQNTASFTNELEKAGLVEQTGTTNSRGADLIALTPEGRDVARLLTARGPTPDWIKKLSSW